VLAELAWKPHVATQVPAQLVGLAVVWEWRWSLGGRGPGYGLAGAPDRSLVGAPARVLLRHRSRPRQGSCRGSRGSLWQGSRRGSSSSGPYLILGAYDLDKDLHAITAVPPEPWFQCGCWWCWDPWAQGWRALLASGKLPRQGSCRGCKGCPGKGLAGGVHLALLLFVFLGLGVALPVSCLWLPSSALFSVAVGAALTAHAQVKG